MSRLTIFLLLIFVVTCCWCSGSGKPGGVGIGISFDKNDKVWIMKVVPGGPAERAGIKEGDELLAVDGRSVSDIPKEELLNRIRGAEGSEVSLTVAAKGGKPRKLRIKRAAIGIHNSPSHGAPLAAPPGSNLPQPQSVQGSVKFIRLSIKDPGLNNIEAVSLLIPAGWKPEGGVQWLNQSSILANLLLRITDPQTGAAIEFLPVQGFTWTQKALRWPVGANYMGSIYCPPIREVPQFIQAFYMPQKLRHLQGARVVGYENLPRVAAEVVRLYGGQYNDGKSGRVRYEYQRAGQQWEEDVYCTIVYGNWQAGQLFWSVHLPCAFRAPKGKLDRLTPLMFTAVATLRISPEWYSAYSYVQQLFLNRMGQSVRDAGALSEAIRRHSQEINQMYSESYRRRSVVEDRINERWSKIIRGVETYKNPYDDRPVQLPSGYNNVWVNRLGEYTMSNDAGFDPNVGLYRSEWRRAEKK
jgi:hypothetical protein